MPWLHVCLVSWPVALFLLLLHLPGTLPADIRLCETFSLSNATWKLSIQTHLVLVCCMKRLCIFGPKGALKFRYYYYYNYTSTNFEWPIGAAYDYQFSSYDGVSLTAMLYYQPIRYNVFNKHCDQLSDIFVNYLQAYHNHAEWPPSA